MYEAEKERLSRYEAMYEEAEEVEDKIDLSDRIFNQERRIKYIEQRIENIDKDVSYSTVYVTITEEKCAYADISFIKLSDLVKGFLGSTSALIGFIFIILPWLVAVGLIWWIVRLVKKKK